MQEFEQIWDRIVSNQGNEFRQKLGKRFTYTLQRNELIPSTTNVSISKSQFEKAWNRMPVTGPGQIMDLIAPSYLYAILVDNRIVG